MMVAKGQRAHNARPDEFYKAVAHEYRIEVRKNGTRGAVVNLASAANVEKALMSTWVRSARKKGFLEPFMKRTCPTCNQFIVPEETDLQIMETHAGDYAEACRKLGLPRIGRLFDDAAEQLSKQDTDDRR